MKKEPSESECRSKTAFYAASYLRKLHGRSAYEWQDVFVEYWSRRSPTKSASVEVLWVCNALSRNVCPNKKTLEASPLGIEQLKEIRRIADRLRKSGLRRDRNTYSLNAIDFALNSQCRNDSFGEMQTVFRSLSERLKRPIDRSILELRFEGLKYEEIAREVGVSPATVSRRLRAAFDQISKWAQRNSNES